MDTKSIVIGVLAIAVAVLGFLYYQEANKPAVKIEVPGVKIEGN